MKVFFGTVSHSGNFTCKLKVVRSHFGNFTCKLKVVRSRSHMTFNKSDSSR